LGVVFLANIRGPRALKTAALAALAAEALGQLATEAQLLAQGHQIKGWPGAAAFIAHPLAIVRAAAAEVLQQSV
tara:strand:+ start:328 stop:549 length:222 start_codon:yes stop_codon:yes gene_type:complete